MTIIDETPVDDFDDEVLEETFEVPDDDIRAFEQAHADLAWVTEKARRLRWVEQQLAEEGALFQAAIDRAELEAARLRERATRISRSKREYATYLRGCLQEWGLRQREASGGKRKSFPLLYGTVVTRESGGGWTPSPEAVEWAKTAHPELVETVEKLKVADAKRAFAVGPEGIVIDKASGERVPGVVVAPKVVTASVELEDAS